MADDQSVFFKMMSKALSGKDAHVDTTSILEDLDWKLVGARPDGTPHSLYQLVNHMAYWQEWVVKWLDGRNPKVPKHAAGGWPGKVSPASRKEWEQATCRFRDALVALKCHSQQADPLSKRGEITRMEMIHLVASHTSYHVGQVAIMRQLLGSWPPPSGGITW